MIGLFPCSERPICWAPGKKSRQRRIIETFKAPCFAYGFLTHLIPKSLRPNTLLLINNSYIYALVLWVLYEVWSVCFSNCIQICFRCFPFSMFFICVCFYVAFVGFILNSLPWWRSAWFRTCQCHSKIFQNLLSIDTLMLSTVRECMSWIVMLTCW